MTTQMDQKPLVAILSNVLTPYRLHLHRRIAREMPEIRLSSLFTHDQPDQPWDLPDLPEIGPVRFGAGHPVSRQGDPRWLRHDWIKGARIIEWIRTQHPAALVVGGYNDLTRLRIIRWCHARGVPLFLQADSNIHGDRATGARRAIKNLYLRWVVQRVTAVLPCGSNGARYYQRYGVPINNIFFFPVEPDYDLIASIQDDVVQRTSERFGLRPGRIRIAVCARLVSRKRVDLAIDAFVAVAGEFPTLDLVIIGDGPERAALEARVPDALRSRVCWTGFIGDQSLVNAVYRLCDVLVLPSDDEPWALVVNEAAASGLAILATNVVGAAPELIREGVNGWTFPPGDLNALIGLLRRALQPAALASLKAASPVVLAEWRQRADPVAGLRRALRAAGVLPPACAQVSESASSS